MIRVAVLTANLNDFDVLFDPPEQVLSEDIQVTFHRYTDENFPPITGLTPRLQYRIPKMWGWQMFPDYDYYIWLDGSFTLNGSNAINVLLGKCIGYDMAFFRHPWRKTIAEETAHIEEYLGKNDKYITPRYANGLHKEQLADCMGNPEFVDDTLLTSTVFVYKNDQKVRDALQLWWLHTSRYFTVDQIALPYVLWKRRIVLNIIEENQYEVPYLKLTSSHK